MLDVAVTVKHPDIAYVRVALLSTGVSAAAPIVTATLTALGIALAVVRLCSCSASD